VNTQPSRSEFAGWLIRDKGQYYLMTDRGWLELLDLTRTDLAAAGVQPESPAHVRGQLVNPVSVRVESIRGAALAAAAPRRPYFAVNPLSSPHLASNLRGLVHQWLRDQNFPELPLPNVWTRSEEYGLEEFQLGHELLPAGKLRLLQSPEFAAWTALAEGVERFFTFGRCFRYEDNPRPGYEGDYLIEFEQLVIARSFSTVAEMVDLTEDLILMICAELKVAIDKSEFLRAGPRGLAEFTLPGGLGIEDVALFTVPVGWNSAAQRVLRGRLLAAGARIHELGEAGRWWVELGAEPPAVRRVLDIAAGYAAPAGGQPASDAAFRQWNPTWNCYPPLAWRDGEGVGTAHGTRSITSRVTRAADGTDRICDAELYLAGREVVHVREYADAAQFLDNIRRAGIPDAEPWYGYLFESLRAAPSGLVGIYVGWERLLSVLMGTEDAASLQAFPRQGDGRAHRPVGPA
jgi:tRNA synthetases class II (D, K and N)